MTSAHQTINLHDAYTEKINSAVEADREELAHELERTFAEELSGLQAARRSSPRTPGVRPPTRLARMGRLTRRSLHRLDRYTVDVFNPGHPYRSAVRPHDSL